MDKKAEDTIDEKGSGSSSLISPGVSTFWVIG